MAYFIGRRVQGRGDGNDIRVQRRHEFARQIATLVEEDYSDRDSLRRYYKANFSHLSLEDALAAIDTHELLYAHVRAMVCGLRSGISKLSEFTGEATMLFNPESAAAVQSYVAAATIGDDPASASLSGQALFTKLLDDENFVRTGEAYGRAIKLLRREIRHHR